MPIFWPQSVHECVSDASVTTGNVEIGEACWWSVFLSSTKSTKHFDSFTEYTMNEICLFFFTYENRNIIFGQRYVTLLTLQWYCQTRTNELQFSHTHRSYNTQSSVLPAKDILYYTAGTCTLLVLYVSPVWWRWVSLECCQNTEINSLRFALSAVLIIRRMIRPAYTK